MTEDQISVKIDTDEHGLTECGCGSNNLIWTAPKDNNAHEADHTLEEAREIGGTFVWDYWDRDQFDDSTHTTYEEMVSKAKARAERNGLRASCKDCYGSMSPTVVTHELADRASRR